MVRTPFTGSGKAHFESPEGEVDGDVQVRVDPAQQRAWLELRAASLFGLVGDRVVLSLPGDGYLLVYRQRGDALERLPFAETPAAPFALGGGVEGFLELLAGQVPWPRSHEDLARRTAVRPGGPGEASEYRVSPAEDSNEEFVLFLKDDRLVRFEWWDERHLRLRSEYDRFVPFGASWFPSRVRVEAPRERVRAELRLEHLEPRRRFEPADFDIGAGSRAEPPGGGAG